MNKKIFTLLLVAVFMLAQFSAASAAPTVDAVVTVDPLPTFSKIGAVGTLDFTMALPGNAVQNVLYYWKEDSTVLWSAPFCVDLPGDVNGLTAATGSFGYVLAGWADQNVIEFYILVVDDATAGACANHVAFMNTAPEVAQASTFIDGVNPIGFLAGPPYLDANDILGDNPVSCNSFELWAIATDDQNGTNGYSGFGGWNLSTSGTFAPPAPEGPSDELVSWMIDLPSTASLAWTFSANPEDVAENSDGVDYFRNALAIAAPELEDCADFPDTAGHADEVYIRYLAELELISGFADGTFGPDNTLTRAEAATLFEKANGVEDTDPGFGTPPPAGDACEFTDVSAADWFSGWVWQACDDGFMNGIGGGLFDPNNLLTRGQVVTIFNNINIIQDTTVGFPVGYLQDDTIFDTVLNQEWNNWSDDLRHALWTDVAIGAYYAYPVIYAYEVGVVEGTSATTFSPDQPSTRGEFAMWLYRALSKTENH